MNSGSAPLRFLAIVLGGWAALRTVLIAPHWSAPPAGVVAAAAQSRPYPALRRGQDARQAPYASGRRFPAESAVRRASRPSLRRPHPVLAAVQPGRAGPHSAPPVASVEKGTVPLPLPPRTFPEPTAADGSTGRWSLSAWAFARRSDSAPLAAGGVLGGSQAGIRLGYRLNRDSARPLALSVRLTSPLPGPRGAEAALGVSWKPSRRFPVHVLAERRQALGRGSRSAFAAGVYGGVGGARLGILRIDAYAQAGIVGARSRDPYGDGAIRLSLPLGERSGVGGGAWAAAQPGLSRLDLGPQATLRLPVAGRSLTVAADWRLRIAGNARPGSGPTLTLATDF